MTGDRSVRDGDVSITSSVDVSSATLISVHSRAESVSVEIGFVLCHSSVLCP